MNKDAARFIKKAIELYGDRYGYNEFVYQDARTKGIIHCSIHGPFEKTPDKHLHRQQGCPDCSRQECAKRRTFSIEVFIAKAIEIHGDRYDYGQFVYMDSQTKGIIRCTSHGPFQQIPAHHLSGHGCTECGKLLGKKTSLARYGAEHHSKTLAYVKKVRATSLARFGVTHRSKAPDFREQMKQTSLLRYGVDYLSQSAGFQERVRATNLRKFGVEHALQAPEVRAKITKTNLQRYGVGNIKRSHITPGAIAILGNKEAIVGLLATHSVNETADFLGIAACTLGRYCRNHGIDLPSSSHETSLVHFLRQHIDNLHMHDRSLIKPLEIDIVLPELKIGIEFCGIWWHGDGVIADKFYHLIKLQRMQQVGYRLITIFEDEWLHKRNITESRLLNLIGASDRGKGARKLTIKETTAKQANLFLNAHHIQGAGPNGYARYGAFDGDQLVAVMVFSRPRVALGRTTGADELLRFATDGKTYPGIASRLFRTYVRDYQPKQVISYADRRWSEGNLYQQLGFTFIHATEPNYWYINQNQIIREHRFKYRKDKIAHLVENGASKTESQIMTELGRYRIWDCGSLKYEWTA